MGKLIKKMALCLGIISLSLAEKGSLLRYEDNTEKNSLEKILSLPFSPAPFKTTSVADSLLRPPMIFEAETYFERIRAPAQLKKQAEFWNNIYTKYNYSEIIFYNSSNFDIAEVLDTGNPDPSLTNEQKLLIRKKMKEFGKRIKDVRFIRGLAVDFSQGFKRAAPYWNNCVQEFSNARVSPDLMQIAFLESCFNPDAVSETKAVGAFQFMEETGRNFLMINNSVDERLDPIRSAGAAALLLRALYARYGHELIAINAYTSGKHNLDKALIFAKKYSQTDNFDELFLSITSVFSKTGDLAQAQKDERVKELLDHTYKQKSSQYVMKFLGARKAFEELGKGFAGEELEFDSVKINYTSSKRLSIKAVMRAMNLSRDEAVILNPAVLWIRNRSLVNHIKGKSAGNISPLLPEGYELRLPPGKGTEFTKTFSGYINAESPVIKNRKGSPSNEKSIKTLGDVLYESIITMRREGMREKVTLDLLNEAMYAYEKSLYVAPGDKNILNSLKVINYDISELTKEINDGYPEKTRAYKALIGELVDQIKQINTGTIIRQVI